MTASYYINESYFLYNKSELIKETFINALNKKVWIYGSISYFNKKTENEIFKIITQEKYLKFYVEKHAKKILWVFSWQTWAESYQSLKTKKFTTFFLQE